MYTYVYILYSNGNPEKDVSIFSVIEHPFDPSFSALHGAYYIPMILPRCSQSIRPLCWLNPHYYHY